MSRYIEYHDICSAIDNQQDGTGMTYEALAHAMVEIQLAPSIDICFCCECKYSEKATTPITALWCKRFGLKDMAVEADDFCSYGEREGE